jgi:hypothetical protein
MVNCGNPFCSIAKLAAVAAYSEPTHQSRTSYGLPSLISPPLRSRPAHKPPKNPFPPPVGSNTRPCSFAVKQGGIQPIQREEMVYEPNLPARTMIAGTVGD